MNSPNINYVWAELIIEELLRNGINRFVISPGSRNSPLIVAVAKHAKTKKVVHVDERSAAFFALGYAKANGKPAVLIATSGTAAANYFPAVCEAGQSGVKIKMIIRSICSLVPGVKRFSENIAAISIVDKYLEHSRIFIFCNGGEEKYYLSSADWMIRNLDNRVEVAVPIYDKRIQKELKTFMDIQFKDRVKARIIDEKQSNRVKKSTADKPVRAQDDIYEWLKSELEKV